MDRLKESFEMRKPRWHLLLIFVMLPLASMAATKQVEQPDKEMLRMMDFLKDWEVINNMEMMKDMQQVAPETNPPPRAGAREPTPMRKKEAAK
jgi:hypothetical protein